MARSATCTATPFPASPRTPPSNSAGCWRSCSDRNGRIAIPGFYEDVKPVPEQFRQAVADLPFSEADWLERSETGSITGEQGYTPLERLWFRPAVEVNSLLAGDPVGISRATVPSLASADLSVRIVAGQRVEKAAGQLREWCRKQSGKASAQL